MFVSRWFTISDEESWFCSRFSVSFFIFSFSSSCNPLLPGPTGVCVCVCALFWLFLLCVCVEFNSLFCSDSIMYLFTEHRHRSYWAVTFNDLPFWTMNSANTWTCKTQRIRSKKNLKEFGATVCIYLDLRWCAATDACRLLNVKLKTDTVVRIFLCQWLVSAFTSVFCFFIYLVVDLFCFALFYF